MVNVIEYLGNIRGPAGYNAVGAGLTDSTIADFILQTAGPSDTGEAVLSLIAVERAKYWMTPADFGAVGDGVTNDAAALTAAIVAQVPLYWGGPDKVYRINSRVQHTLTKDLVWHSDGARILVNPASSLGQGVQIITDGHSVHIDGALTMDCNMLAFVGWDFYSTSTTYADFYARRLRVKNVYRKDQTITGGSGIRIRGGFTTIVLDQPYVYNVVMAAGAGVLGSQGISGITITSSAAGVTPISVSVNQPYVDRIWCEDPAYFVDQDAILIFTESDNGTLALFDTHFLINGGVVANSRGRGVKSQAEFGTISNVKFVRDRDQLLGIGGPGTMPEIDFQVGGGTVTNCEARYNNSSPNRIIQWSGTRQVGGKASTGLDVRGFKVSSTGTTNALIDSFVTATMFEQLRPTLNISDVTMYNPSYFLNGNFVVVSGTVATELFVRLTNCSVNLNTGNYAFYRTGPNTLTTYLTIQDFAKTRTGNGNLSGAANAGNLTVVAAGNNVRMV
jgi:hypothetical protein